MWGWHKRRPYPKSAPLLDAHKVKQEQAFAEFLAKTKDPAFEVTAVQILAARLKLAADERLGYAIDPALYELASRRLRNS